MKQYLLSSEKIILFFLMGLAFFHASAQLDTTTMGQPSDTSLKKLNMDAVYSRPFLSLGKMPVAIGGYLEANTRYENTNGISEGFSFQFRRMTIFLSSTIAKKIRFLSEIEFEDGAKEINLEYSAINLELNPLLNLQGGIILNPIGGFNQNHDGPRWDFIDRPLSAVTILPATLSNVGIGFHGKYFIKDWVLGYETYLTNGFGEKIISNAQNRTSLQAGKSNPGKFEESQSGLPMFTGKVALRNRKVGEAGFSYMNGVYNQWRKDGLVVENKRELKVFSVDFNSSFLNNKISVNSEVVKVLVEIPETYSQIFGKEQLGFFVDLTGTVFQGQVFGWEKAKFNLALRFNYVDYNVGKFKETGGNISDHVWGFVPGVAFRPVGSSVFRINYSFSQSTDLLGNPPSKTGTIQVGISSYF